MKKYTKILLSIFALIFIITINGCFFSKNTNTTTNSSLENKEQSISGKLRPLGPAGYKDAHYLISISDGTVAYTKSKSVNLDDILYKDKDLIFIGNYIKNDKSEKNAKEIFEIKKIEIPETQINTSELTEVKKYQYINQALGIKFIFKNNFEVNYESQNKMALRWKLNTNIIDKRIQILPTIEVSILDKTIPIQENQTNINENITSTPTPNNFSDLYKWAEKEHKNIALYQSTIGPDKTDGVKAEISNTQTIFYLKRGQQIYQINFQTVNIDTFANSRQNFLEMLNSFEFIPIQKNTNSHTIDITDSDKAPLKYYE